MLDKKKESGASIYLDQSSTVVQTNPRARNVEECSKCVQPSCMSVHIRHLKTEEETLLLVARSRVILCNSCDESTVPPDHVSIDYAIWRPLRKARGGDNPTDETLHVLEAKGLALNAQAFYGLSGGCFVFF